MRRVAGAALGVAVMAAAAMPASASPWFNYFPATFGSDDGVELFQPGPAMLGVKFADIIGETTPVTSFGFYFASNPGVPVTLWEEGAPLLDVVAVDFINGFAVDTATNQVQAVFAPTPGPIGFFQTIAADVAAPVTLYTQGAPSPFGIDYAGTFPSLIDPSAYLITFNVAAADGSETLLSALLVSPVIAEIAEPASLALLALAVAPLLRRRRRCGR